MATLYDRILSWAESELKYWERSAFERIAAGRDLQAQDYEDLLQYFMEDAGLAAWPATRPDVSLPAHAANNVQGNGVRLRQIFAVQNVNALPPNQELAFGPQLTLVYGDNGAGKTGYARILGGAATGRGKREVLPNVALPPSDVLPQASIEILEGSTKTVLRWKAGERCKELANFYVFDDVSRVVYLSQANSFAFAPGDLWLLTRLAEATDSVRDRMRQVIAREDWDETFEESFNGESSVRELLRNVNSQTDIEKLRQLASLTEADCADISRLERTVAELQILDVPTQLGRKENELSDLRNLVNSIAAAEIALGERAESQVRKLFDEVRARRGETESRGAGQFSFKAFSQTGTDKWLAFLVAAKSLAEAESTHREPYPKEDDSCLLCRQPLQRDAVRTITAYWDFLTSDSQVRLDRAVSECTKKEQELDGVNVDYFSGHSAVRRLVRETPKSWSPGSQPRPRLSRHAKGLYSRACYLRSGFYLRRWSLRR